MNKLSARPQLWGVFLALSGGILWGLSGTCGSYLFQYHGVTASWLVPIRLTCAGIILLTVLLLRQGKAVFAIWQDRRDSAELLVFTAFGMTACQFTYFYTIQLSNAGLATVLQYLGPAMVLVYISVRHRHVPERHEVAALICSLIGVFVIATHGDPGTLAISPPALCWGVISAVTLLINTVQPIRLLGKHPAPLILGWAMLLGGVLLSILFRPWAQGVTVTPSLVLALVVIILLGTIFSFTAYMTAVGLIGPSRASLIACIEPVSATILSALLLGTQFLPMDLLGFGLVIATPVILALHESTAE